MPGIEPAPLPANVNEQCDAPEALVSPGGTVADDEITIARLGVALIICDARRATAVDGYEGVRQAVKPRGPGFGPL